MSSQAPIRTNDNPSPDEVKIEGLERDVQLVRDFVESVALDLFSLENVDDLNCPIRNIRQEIEGYLDVDVTNRSFRKGPVMVRKDERGI